MLKFCLLLLQCEIESNKQNAARQSALVQSLRERIREAEDSAAEKENFANRSDITITSLKKEMQNQQDRLQQVESSLKHHISAEEEASSRAAKWESKVLQLYKSTMWKLVFTVIFTVNSLLIDTLVKHRLELVPSGRPRPSDKGGGWGGARHPDPEIRWGPSLKKIFFFPFGLSLV